MKRRTNGSTPGVTKEECEEALRAAAGVVSIAAGHIGVHRNTMFKAMRRWPSLRKFQADLEEEVKDLAEAQLFEKIREGHVTSIIFFLKCKAKDRGYIERHEMTGPAGGAIETRSESIADFIGRVQAESSPDGSTPDS